MRHRVMVWRNRTRERTWTTWGLDVIYAKNTITQTNERDISLFSPLFSFSLSFCLLSFPSPSQFRYHPLPTLRPPRKLLQSQSQHPHSLADRRPGLHRLHPPTHILISLQMKEGGCEVPLLECHDPRHARHIRDRVLAAHDEVPSLQPRVKDGEEPL